MQTQPSPPSTPAVQTQSRPQLQTNPATADRHESLLPRRRFLRQLGGSLLAAPFVTRGLMADSPNGKLRHASFGAAGMATGDINAIINHGGVELVAVADVDSRAFARIKQAHPDVRCFQDWREMMAEMGDQIDSVNVSTPDHMHGVQVMSALERGIHVYDQKPLAQNIAECRALTLKARETGVINQMGIQLSSTFNERLVAALVEAGAIGKVKEVHTFSDKKWGDPNPRPDRSDDLPAELDWDGWLGVASERTFINNYYHPGNWRRRRDFGTGTLGDMGCHIFSSWFRALKLTSPDSIRSDGDTPNDYNWANNLRVEYIFPATEVTEGDQVKVVWYDGDQRPPQEVAALIEGALPGQGSVLIGTEGVMLAPHASSPRLFPAEKFRGYQYPRLEPRNHYGEFVDACRSGNGEQPSANFEYSGPLTEIVLLGCIASAFPGETMQWNPQAMTVDHEDANKLMRRDYRDGWQIEGFPAT